jgi:hypothetical protein
MSPKTWPCPPVGMIQRGYLPAANDTSIDVILQALGIGIDTTVLVGDA